MPSPTALPQRCSASAAALTSVSIAHGTPSAAASVPATSVSLQPGFGVVVMWPQVGEPGRRSSGPKQPIPTAAMSSWPAKNETARAIVSRGEVVANVTLSRTSPGGAPTAQTHLVPPASIPP